VKKSPKPPAAKSNVPASRYGNEREERDDSPGNAFSQLQQALRDDDSMERDVNRGRSGDREGTPERYRERRDDDENEKDDDRQGGAPGREKHSHRSNPHVARGDHRDHKFNANESLPPDSIETTLSSNSGSSPPDESGPLSQSGGSAKKGKSMVGYLKKTFKKPKSSKDEGGSEEAAERESEESEVVEASEPTKPKRRNSLTKAMFGGSFKNK
jgi:hypothetical protein